MNMKIRKIVVNLHSHSVLSVFCIILNILNVTIITCTYLLTTVIAIQNLIKICKSGAKAPRDQRGSGAP